MADGHIVIGFVHCLIPGFFVPPAAQLSGNVIEDAIRDFAMCLTIQSCV